MFILLLIIANLHRDVMGVENCRVYGSHEGSEDVSLWQDGIAFVSSGLYTSKTQGGLMLAVDLSRDDIGLYEMTLRNMPDGFGFRPHGIYIDNSTQRVFAISHSDQLKEESIVVFNIVPSSGRVPVLDFLFALTSPNFPYYPDFNMWFLNDLSVINPNELYVTQWGPFYTWPPEPRYLFHCTWKDTDLRPDGRLPASCNRAYTEEISEGLNGMTVDASKNKIWVNDLLKNRLWVFDRQEDGTLVRGDDIKLPGMIDNVEYDFKSGDLIMGMIREEHQRFAGNIISRRTSEHSYADPKVVIQIPEEIRHVSSSLEYGKWVVLGSPGDIGLYICSASSIVSSNVSVTI